MKLYLVKVLYLIAREFLEHWLQFAYLLISSMSNDAHKRTKVSNTNTKLLGIQDQNFLIEMAIGKKICISDP